MNSPLSRLARLRQLATAPRRATGTAVALALCSHLSLATASEAVDRSADCTPTGGNGGSRQLECRLEAPEGGVSYRFVARFSGSHDDTVLSLQAALDGTPEACGPGSTTYLVGEDGDVSLQCKLASLEPAGPPRLLKVLVRWSHAEFGGFDLLRD